MVRREKGRWIAVAKRIFSAAVPSRSHLATELSQSMILLIDNYDSFTYNLYQLIESLGGTVKVFPHDGITLEEIRKLRPEAIVLSPGPKTPSSAGISIPTVREFHISIPILGICLGHQCIGAAFGSRIQPAKRLIHGRTTRIFHSRSKLLSGLSTPFHAARYHRWRSTPFRVDSKKSHGTVRATLWRSSTRNIRCMEFNSIRNPL